ncbi:MAG: response regulator transcription factor [Proteobacteria bacterium]|nr:MAG: response regulator transcription factor [Pseudomonadota bacterium]
MDKILLIEDLAEYQVLVRGVLGPQFQVACVETLRDAAALLAKEKFNAIILDALLPDGDGLKFCAELRSGANTSNIPLVMLTARGSITDKVAAFSNGADDYVTKPFEPLELKARIEALVKRFSERNQSAGTLVRGSLRLATEEYKAYAQEGSREQELKLTPMEFRLLQFLIKNEHRVVTRADILQGVWGSGVFVVDRVIDKHVSSLRQKLGVHSEYIQTVPRLGYQFQVPSAHLAEATFSAQSSSLSVGG